MRQPPYPHFDGAGSHLAGSLASVDTTCTGTGLPSRSRRPRRFSFPAVAIAELTALLNNQLHLVTLRRHDGHAVLRGNVSVVAQLRHFPYDTVRERMQLDAAWYIGALG